MKLSEYEKKLGIKNTNIEKDEKFRNFILAQIESFEDSYHFTQNEKQICKNFFIENCISNGSFYFSTIIFEMRKIKDIKQIVLLYSSFINIVKRFAGMETEINRIIYRLKKAISDHCFNYTVIEDSDGYYILQIDNDILDDKLIIESFEFMYKYPEIRKMAIECLDAYNNINENNISEVVDRFRKLLEQFMQKYFKLNKTLSEMKSLYGDRLKEAGVSTEISSEFTKILNLYDMYNNNNAKHHENAKRYDVEYIMYETFNIIRLLLQIE